LKKDPNDELRFLMENPTRSDFFIVMAIMYVYVSNCWLESKTKTPAEIVE